MKRSYLKKYLGSAGDVDVERLKQDYEKIREENTRLRKQIEDVRKEVYESLFRSKNAKLTTDEYVYHL